MHKEPIPLWMTFPIIFAAIILMLAAFALILLSGPVAYDILGPDASSLSKVAVIFGSILTGLGCGTGSCYLLKELFSCNSRKFIPIGSIVAKRMVGISEHSALALLLL